MGLRSRMRAAWLSFKDAGWSMTLGGLQILLDLYARPSKTGQTVNEETAVYLTFVFAVIMRIAFGIAQVPWKIYELRADGNGKDEARKHALWRVLHRKPNQWQNSFNFRVTMVLHLLLTNRFVAFVNRTSAGIVEIIPFDPARIDIKKPPGSYDLQFWLTGDDGQRRQVPSEQIWYIQGPTWDGWSPDKLKYVKLAREAIGLAMTAEENQAK